MTAGNLLDPSGKPQSLFIEVTWSGTNWLIESSLSGLTVETNRHRRDFTPEEIERLAVRRRFWGLGRAELQGPNGAEKYPLPRLRRLDQHELNRLLGSYTKLREAQVWKLQTDALVERAKTRLRWIDSESVAAVEALRPRNFSLRSSGSSWEQEALRAVSLNIQELSTTTNEWIVQAEFKASRAFFESIEKSPLTEEQARAVVTYDNRVQVVAAAGSGKTSVMVARAAYALRKGFVKPSEILLLAFNRDAADELQSRVEERLSSAGIPTAGIKASTFHALGLRTMGLGRGKKPSLAPWVGNPNQELKELEAIVDGLRDQSEYFRDRWDQYRLLFAPMPAGGPETGTPDSPRSDGERGYRTFAGEVVKSAGERLIADWLYLHHVEYLYETDFWVDTATPEHGQYTPDFFYPHPDKPLPAQSLDKGSDEWQTCLRSGTWHEHWALDQHGKAPKEWVSYEPGMNWKRALHKEHGSDFLETTWWGVLHKDHLERLRRELEDRGHVLRFDPVRIPEAEEPVSHGELLRLIRTFISHAKSNSLTVEMLRERMVGSPLAGTRTELFLSLFDPIFREWEQRLARAGHIDFDDMLVQAAEHLEQGDVDLGYSLILADEFQDSSIARTRMLRGLLGAPNRHLLAVGDDWQSINRFAGADIHSMLEFEKTFGAAIELQLTRTFRCPPEIVELSSGFVQQNPDQLRKAVSTTIPEPQDGSVRLVLTDITEETIAGELERIAGLADANETEDRPTVLALGRYSFDRQAVPPAIVPPGIDYTFKTIHAAKGLEADYVLLLNLRSNNWGFPSTVLDDPILGLAMPRPDSFLFAEERRLFYVGLTRAKKQVTLLTPHNNPSPFIVEVFNEGLLTADIPIVVCTVCDQGILVQKESDRGPFFSCSTWPACDNTAQVCPHCEQGCLIRVSDHFECNQPLCNHERHRPCSRPKCTGMMAKKDGSRGAFYGCTRFPSCRNTASSCPGCDSGAVVITEQKAICDRSPECRWEAALCRECVGGFLITRRGPHGRFKSCSNFATTCTSAKAIKWRESR